MAEGEDSAINGKNSEKLNNEGLSVNKEAKNTRPELEFIESHVDSNENAARNCTETESSSSKSNGAIRKEENPFSFRHFLKRDLSLPGPGNASYESTGARPKVFASPVQPHSSRDESPSTSQQKPTTSTHHISDNTASSSSVDLPYSAVENSESKNNLFCNNSEPFFHRPNLASEPLGMPSLPDFVQDHILVEQAYLNTNGPISVDLDNLPDFTFNTNFNAGASSWSQRKNSYSSTRGYDYDEYGGVAGSSGEQARQERDVPLDLPIGAEAAGLPLDLAPHLNLDLTESVNPADRRNNSPRSNFPLDLPGAEGMRLPDCLPAHPGRPSPEPDHHDEQLHQILNHLERTRSELFTERTRRCRVESELETAQRTNEDLRARIRDLTSRPPAVAVVADPCNLPVLHGRDEVQGAAARPLDVMPDIDVRSPELESSLAEMRKEIKRLKESLAASQSEVRSLRSAQSHASRDLRQATTVAEASLRDLLAGLDQLRTISATLDPT